jgi:hypothetical protein
MRRARLLAPLILCGSLVGCGGDDQATEERIAREREEAALIATQQERIEQLERGRDGEAGASETPASTPAPVRPSEDTAPSPDADRALPASEDASGAEDDWPGGSAYTTILASVGSETEARRIQSEASGDGLDAGVLFSSTYRSLRPGFWVVFSGTSSDKADAGRRSSRAKSLGYSSAYPRFVSE